MLDTLATTMPQLLRADAAMARQARFARLQLGVEAGAERWTVSMEGGEVAAKRGAAAAPDITLRATPAAWAAFGQALPPVGFQSLDGMLRAGHLEVAGDLLAFGRHLLLIEALLASLRGVGPAVVPSPVGKPWIEGITGRYLHVDLAGRPHRIYFEEAGAGIPLLCLHTAGSDGRQYRALLNDAEITRHYRVIAFDLPRHGKSSPPVGYQREVYRLTTDLYVDTTMTVSRALGLERPVVIGCSIGGRAVLHLAARHPTDFRAAIGLQSALAADPGHNPILREIELIDRPDVHGGMAAAATVACLIAPGAPAADRWETLWHYAQSGPGVFAGDLHYYSVAGELCEAELATLVAGACPLYLLTGEYDLSATPARTTELARRVKARHCEVMPGLGHFPMSESPHQFRRYLLPLLDRIRAE